MKSIVEKLKDQGTNVKDFIINKTKEGLYPEHIAFLLNVHESTIRRYAKDLKIKVKKRKRVRPWGNI